MYNQKPDRSLAGIRAELDRVGQVYMLAPSGLGCDLIAFKRGAVIFLEVKNPEDKNRDVEKLLTARERILKYFCDKFGIDYHVVFTPEQALTACGWTVE